MQTEPQYHEGWEIGAMPSGDAVMPWRAVAIKWGRTTIYADGQTRSEAIERVRAKVDIAERLGS